MQRITSESNIEEVMKDIGVGPEEELRESEKRRRNLEKFAQLRSRNPNTSVSLKDAHTAYVEAQDGEDEFIDITITTRKFPQERYELPEEYHQYLIQKGMTIHEAAHIMYSSYPALEKYLDKVEDEDDNTHKQMFANIYNALEDGAIETFAQEDYRVEEELFHLRATLHENNYMGQKVEIEDEVQYHYPFYYAVMTALLNIGVYDNGELRKLLDEDNDQHQIAFRGGEMDRKMLVELLPDCRDYIEKIQDERDAEKRAELCYELWTEIKKYIDRSTTPGKKEMERQQENREQESYADGVPANIGDEHGDQKRTPSGRASDSDEQKPLGDSREEMAEQIAEKAKEIEEKAQRDVVEEAKGEGGDWSDELEEIISSLGAGDGTDEIFVPEDGEIDIQRRREAEIYGKRCAKIFRTRLQRLRKDKEISGKKRGSFDSRRIMQADRGSTNVFKQTREGDNKDYSCMIVCDRSGSMGGRIEDVELAMGAVAYGLDSVGVDTSILDTFKGKTSLAKPFGTDVADFEKKLFAGRVRGGTPLRHTTSFARQRMERGGGKVPFMIVITDGGARYPDKFKEEVKKANFPVIGLYLTEHEPDGQLEKFDRAVVANSDDDVAQKLINLINNLMF